MSALLLERFKRRITGLNLVPDAGGCFEVTAGEALIYSKLATGEFPDEQTLLDDVATRLPPK